MRHQYNLDSLKSLFCRMYWWIDRLIRSRKTVAIGIVTAILVIAFAVNNDFNFFDKIDIVSYKRVAYNFSVTAQQMFDNWGNRPINVTFRRGKAEALPGTGNIFIDLNYIDELSYIDTNGKQMAQLWEGDISKRTISRGLAKIGFTRKKRMQSR